MTTPERRLARRLVEVKQLEPPVDIAGLVEQYAIIEYLDFPADCDAVVVRLGQATRPRVILHRRRAEVRQRFTLAHELGHLIIGWHVGSILCHVDVQEERAYYGQSEVEANRFASEVLVPLNYLRDVMAEEDSLGDMLERVAAEARVSGAVTAIALAGALPPGYVILSASRGRTTFSAKSTATRANVPYEGEPVDLRDISLFADRSGRVQIGSSILYWYEFSSSWAVGDDHDSSATATELLGSILADLGLAPDKRQHVTQSVNGIIGAAKSQYGAASVREVLATLRARFVGRPALASVVQHELFEEFLHKKAAEITDGLPSIEERFPWPSARRSS